MEANIRNTFPIIYSDLLGLFLFQFSAYTFKQTPSRTNMADAINITSPTNKSSKFYSAFAMSAALNILSFPFAILLIILVIFSMKTKRRVCTKSKNSLACLATTDLSVGLNVQPSTMTNFSLMHIGGRIQTVT